MAVSKQSIVGSVAVISESEIQSQPATTITQAIQGSVPGINVVNTGGVPGTNPTIRIRGVGSINASAGPLIIVDGAPFNGNLNSIAQEQVASISVLKDASSTSLYGSRGANGVIIVTGNNPLTGEYASAVSGKSPVKRKKEKNYASYIGVEGKPELVQQAVELIRKFATYIKKESPGKREYI